MTQDQQEFIDILFDKDNKTHYSNLIFDLMSRPMEFAPINKILDLEWRKDRLQDFKKITDLFIDKLGWIEHTSDWDPYFIIKTEDGTRHETDNGYYDFTIKGETITFKGDDDEPDEDYVIGSFSLNIKDITSICLER